MIPGVFWVNPRIHGVIFYDHCHTRTALLKILCSGKDSAGVITPQLV
jgi:hypothetical protein